MIQVKSVVSTHFSNFRKANEDNFTINGRFMNEKERKNPLRIGLESKDDLQYFAVTDGMGGPGVGDLAAITVVEGLRHEYQKWTYRPKIDFKNIKDNLKKFVHSMNRTIYFLVDEPEKESVGSTLALLVINGNKAMVMNVGNSRVYLYRRGILKQLSVDHTVTQRFVNLGVMEKDKTIKDGGKKQLTRTLGMNPSESNVEPDFSEIFEVEEGDRFLICSDGLSIPIEDNQIIDMLEQYKDSTICSEQLVAAALEEKSKDNITALLVDVLNVKNDEKLIDRGISDTERRLLHGQEEFEMDEFEIEKKQEEIYEDKDLIRAEAEEEVESWYQDIENEIRENRKNKPKKSVSFDFKNIKISKEIIIGVAAIVCVLFGFLLGRVTAPKVKDIENKEEVNAVEEKNSLEDIIYAPEDIGDTQETETTTEEVTETEIEDVETTDVSENVDNGEIPSTYVVEKGDTLYSISIKFYGDGAHIDAILKLNDLKDASKIFPKQELKLPPK